MYYRIRENIALRSWKNTGFSYYEKGRRAAVPLSPGQMKLLLLCDGEHDLDTGAGVLSLALRGLIEPCEKGERPSGWSAYREYDNLYFPMMNLMITGKCNFNCRHCFNAADNAALNTEWDFDELSLLLDQAADCGIHGFTITGGEPMVHERFLDILKEIHKRGMAVFTLNTNGFFLTREILEEMKAMGCTPEMRISFDGIGTHDWIRGFHGAEISAASAISLCVENGFPVTANTQVHRKNLHTLLPTAAFLDSLGVLATRFIRTTEAPRWKQNAPDQSLSLEEYYGAMLQFAEAYSRSGLQMDVEAWQFLGLLPKSRSFYLKPVKCADGEYNDGVYCCNCTHQMTAVTSSGEIMPCHQMSGYFLKYGISLGNVRTTPLKEYLSGSPYADLANMTLGQLREAGGKCSRCPYFPYCGGGCRALGRLLAGKGDRFTEEDLSKCYFFENGWYEKITGTLAGWKNLSKIKFPEPFI